jgi:hypothetical protein
MVKVNNVKVIIEWPADARQIATGHDQVLTIGIGGARVYDSLRGTVDTDYGTLYDQGDPLGERASHLSQHQGCAPVCG